MKILPVGAGLLHADRQSNGRTERNSEVNGHFLQFCEERLADATEHVPSWRAPVLPSVGELWSCSHFFSFNPRLFPYKT